MSTTPEQRATAAETVRTAIVTADPSAEDAAKARTAVYAEIESELLAGAPWPVDAGARVLAAEQAAHEAVAARTARHEVRRRLHATTA